MSEEAVLEDGAFYDRFLRKKVGSAGANDIKKIIEDEYPDICKVNAAEESLATRFVKVFETGSVDYLLKLKEAVNKIGIECSYGDILRIAANASGTVKSGKSEMAPVDICEYEAKMYFDSKLKSRTERAKLTLEMLRLRNYSAGSLARQGEAPGVDPAAFMASPAPFGPAPTAPAAPGVPQNAPPSWFSPLSSGDDDRIKQFKIAFFVMYHLKMAGGRMMVSDLVDFITRNIDDMKGQFGDDFITELLAKLNQSLTANGDMFLSEDNGGGIGQSAAPQGAIPVAVKETSKNEKRYSARFDAEARKLFFDSEGPGLNINKDIAGRLNRYIAAKKREAGKGELVPSEEDAVITGFFMDELDYFVDRDEKRMLSAVARSKEYGNGVIRIEGATGAGKTYTAEMLSRIMDFGDEVRPRFYAEPVNKETKLARFLGYFRADKYGYYSIDQTTPFLDIIKYGGVAAVSEINTAVKDEYAKLAWWFIQLARGDKEISLNEYPRKGENGAISPSVRRHPKSLVILDVNPEDYEGRGKFPRELIENTPSVYVDEKMNDIGHIKKVVRAFLKHIDDGEKKDALVDFISASHVKIFDKVKEANENGDRYPPLSYRELARVARSISAGFSRNIAYLMAEQAVERYYIQAFISENIKNDLRRSLGFHAAPEGRDMIIKDLLLDKHDGRSPPVLVTSSSDEDPFEDIDSAVNKFKEENPERELARERVRITWFDDEFKLFGGFLPIALREKAATARAKLKVLLADKKIRGEANGIYRELRKESGRPEQDLPEDISGLDDGYILSLSEALDPLRGGQEWRQALKYENGVIPRLIEEASREKEKNGDKAKNIHYRAREYPQDKAWPGRSFQYAAAGRVLLRPGRQGEETCPG
jgi:hypothetical protein